MTGKIKPYTIALHKTFWGKEEEKAAIKALRSGTGVGDLNFSDKLSQILKNILSINYVLPTGSGTAALELACATSLKKGDEVILPSFTFPSCANAVILAGAKPIFADIDINTYNIDPKEIEKKITKRTKAIMVVHYAGMACNMDWVNSITKSRKLILIEDAAHSLGAKYNNQHLGTFGDIGCYSFHGTKNISAGEGGFFAARNSKITNLAEIIREKGTNRASFLKGERKKYSWIKVGRSLVLSDILSAIAFEQIKKLTQITSLRKKNAEFLLKKLNTLSSKIILPVVSEGTDPNWHIFAIRVPRTSRDKVIKGLRSFGVEASFHYLPLHSSVMGKQFGYKLGHLPVTEEISKTLVRLPMHPRLKKNEMEYMTAALEKIL